APSQRGSTGLKAGVSGRVSSIRNPSSRATVEGSLWVTLMISWGIPRLAHGMTRLELFSPHVVAQKRRHIQILTFHDCRLAFFKTTASERLELQDFLLRCGSLI